MFFKVSEATAARRRVPIHCADATDGITPETGEAAGQPQVSKNGGAWANTSATLVAIGNGAYYVELTATELNTIGLIQVRYKSANTAEYQIDGFVFSYDPYDAAGLGLSRLDAAVSSRMATFTYTVPPTAAAVATAVWAESTRALTDKANFTLAVTPPTAAAISTAVWAETVRALTDKAGFSLATAPPTAAAISTAVWAEATRTLTSGAAPSAAVIADAVWDEVMSGHLTGGTTGASLNGAGAAGDPWTASLPGAYGSGTAGNIIGNRIDAAVTSRMATFTYTAPPTAAAVSTQVWSETVRALTDKAGFSLATAPPTAAAIATAVWSESARTLTSFGTLVADAAAAVWAAATRTLTASSDPSAASVASAVWGAVSRTLTGSSGSAPTAAEVADAVWDESLAGHLTAGTTGNKLNTLTGAGGGGAISYTYTVTSSVSGLPIDDVQVWVTTDAAGLNVVASGRTNALGAATMALDAGSYYFWCSKSGFNFANPDLEVVS